MSETQEKSIHLQEPIEFLIFNQSLISCKVNNAEYIVGRIKEIPDDTLILELEVDDTVFLTINPGDIINAACNYRSKRLEFNLDVLEYDNREKILTAKFPYSGVLIDSRRLERTCFDSENTSLMAKIEIETILGPKKFSTTRISQFTYKSISFYIDRTQGLIMPNDVAKNVVIYDKNHKIFIASGVVIRIDSESIDEIFVVLILDDPNAKPVYDIEPNKRRSDRLIFEGRTDAFIEFTHPFSKTRKLALLHDISNSGVSVHMQDSKYAMPPGLLIENASMQLPLNPRLTVTLRVKGYFEDEDDPFYRVCMEFVDASPEVIKAVTGFVQQKVSSHLQDATSDDIEELWYFYFETGFIYQGKRRQLQDTSKIVKNTFTQLLKSNTTLIKKILYKEDGQIKGHVTAIKVFDRTLMVQHLNALKSKDGPAAMHVIRAITSFFLDSQANDVLGSRYICFYYRPDNFYPKLVFGTAVKLIEDEEICWTLEYGFCLPDLNYVHTENNDVHVYEAGAEDLNHLESQLIHDKDYRNIRLEGLTRETMTNMEVSELYESIGLYRYRKVFVASCKHSGQRVYAVCTYASPGLNFSELTNSIKLYYHNVQDGILPQLVDSVCYAAYKSYEKTELSNPVLLLKQDQLRPECFIPKKSYTLFALDIRHTKKFKDATEHVYANFRDYVKESRVKVN